MINTPRKINDVSYDFSLLIIKFYKHLVCNEKEYILSKQILRSGTSIGANINESKEAQSKRDFLSKMNISLKEARETEYWLHLLKDSNYLDSYDKKYQEVLFKEINTIIRILSKIVKTTKNNLNK